MKKTLLLLGMAAIAAVACNKTQTVKAPEAQNEIAFKAVAGAITKADPEFTGTAFATSGTDLNKYLIYAGASAQSQDVFFSDKMFAYCGTKWEAVTSDPGAGVAGTAVPIYWPVGGEKVDFLALAMTSNAHTQLSPSFNASKSASDVTISSWDTFAKQYDVMYAAKNAQSSTSNSGAVALTFKHAQALLSFTAQYTGADVFTLNSITIKDLDHTGTLVVDNSKTELVAKWTISAHADKSVTGIVSTVSASATKCSDNLLVPEQDAKTMVVNYAINGQNRDFTLSIPRQAWEMGKKYIYALNFTATEITVTPSVTDWDDSDSPADDFDIN